VIALVFELAILVFLVFALLDRRAHQEHHAFGINQWGFREEARAAKEPGEVRVVLVGGSAAFERDMEFARTIAGKLLIELGAAGAPFGQHFSVSNLAEPAVGADSHVETIRSYAYLQPDAVVLFDGYDRLIGLPPHARRQSIVYRTFGYLPILPARLLGQPGWMSDPDGGIADQLGHDQNETTDVSCTGRSDAYCAAMATTVAFALERGYVVLVASPPTVTPAHRRQQQSLGTLLIRQFGTVARFKYIDLGGLIDLGDRMSSPDGVHRTELGNHEVAQRIATSLLRWSAFPGRRSR